MHDDPLERNRIARPPGPGLPLDYARTRAEPRTIAILPLFGGLVIGISTAGCLGAVSAQILGMGADRGIVIGSAIFVALLAIVRAAQHARRRNRNWFDCLMTGVMLGAGITVLVEIASYTLA